MKILIIGASRGIGKVLLEEALGDGHDVSVMARHPEKITVSHVRLGVHQGDVRDRDSVAKRAKGCDVVCSCIGEPITFKPCRSLFYVGKQHCLRGHGEPGAETHCGDRHRCRRFQGARWVSV